MKFSKTIPLDTLQRDAEIVQQMHERMSKFDSEKNIAAYEGAVRHFEQKYGVSWEDFVVVDTDKREGARGL